MKAFKSASLSIAAALLCSSANASPAAPLQERQAAEITTAVLQIFREVLKGTKLAFPLDSDAWEIKSNPHMCRIDMETTDGGNCYAKVTCDDGVQEYNVGKAGWNVCYIGGRQHFTDPRIGDFSITFTSRDKQGEGLTGPVLQLSDIGDWTAIPVADLADERASLDYGNNDPYKGRTRKWFCGVPKRGQNFKGLDSNMPASNVYAPGSCGIHITQYQKPDPSKDPYSLAAKIYDANQNEIGNSNGKQLGPVLVLTTPLPNTFTITARNIDADSLKLGYDGREWDAIAPACSVGAYDSGKRGWIVVSNAIRAGTDGGEAAFTYCKTPK